MRERGLALGLMIASALGAVWLASARETPDPQPVAPAAPRVQVVPVVVGSHSVDIDLSGTVRAARSLTLVPEVAGRVVHQHPDLRPGAVIPRGEVLVRLDPRSYRLEIARQEALVHAQKLVLEEERARHEIAKWELGLLDQREPREQAGQGPGALPPGFSDRLGLREPHLNNAEASVRGAEAALEQARIRLEQTTLKSPFDALVLSESTEVGQVVSPGTPLATLVASDAFWVEASVASAHLPFLVPDGKRRAARPGQSASDPRAGSALPRVVVRAGPEDTARTWPGAIVEVLGDLDTGSRMARVLIEVRDPLAGEVPLLLGAFVHVQVRGRALSDVARVPRGAVDGEGYVWLVERDDQTLARKRVQVAFRERETLLVRGLRDGQELVAQPRETFVEGMRVQARRAHATVHRGGHAPSPPCRQSRQGPTPPRGSLRSPSPLRSTGSEDSGTLTRARARGARILGEGPHPLRKPASSAKKEG